MPSLAFPDGFVWGTATAAHQVEGGNWNNDWWAWEHMPDTPCVEPSADACDHYHRYPDDVRLLASLGSPRTASRSSGAASSRRRALLARRARPLPPHVCGVPRARPRGHRHVPPLHDARAGWSRAAAGPSRPRRIASPASASAPPPTWESDLPRVHAERAQHRRYVRPSLGVVPARTPRSRLTCAPTTSCRRASQGGRRRSRAAAAPGPSD